MEATDKMSLVEQVELILKVVVTVQFKLSRIRHTLALASNAVLS
jgi:hypothetical protein